MCSIAISRLSRQLPVTFRTVHRVAIHGMYSRQKMRKENADRGVNISDSIVKRVWSETDDATTRVLITASLAVSPAITAAAARQSPNPRGAKRGAAVLPQKARMLSLLSDTGCRSKLYDRRYQIRTEAVKMTVKAFLINPMMFLDTSDITACISGL